MCPIGREGSNPFLRIIKEPYQGSFFVYDEENYKITDRKNNISYTMGDTLKVIVTGASYDRMEIEVVPFSEEEIDLENTETEDEGN